MATPLKKNIALYGITLALFLVSCSKKQSEELTPDPPIPDPPTEQVTYTNFVAPLFQTKCASCHAPGKAEASVWSFNGYSSVTGNSATIKQVVLVTKTMPQVGSLSAAELQSLQKWFDLNMPQ